MSTLINHHQNKHSANRYAGYCCEYCYRRGGAPYTDAPPIPEPVKTKPRKCKIAIVKLSTNR